jgi:hypothetical protein
MVRNEADIVEAFVRHNLAFVDGIAIFDHRSTDATPAILARLKAEGLPITLLQDSEEGFYQGSRVTTLARECFARTQADFAFVLDADEFIRADSRALIEAALARVPPGHFAVHDWRSYVPATFAGPFGPALPALPPARGAAAAPEGDHSALARRAAPTTWSRKAATGSST